MAKGFGLKLLASCLLLALAGSLLAGCGEEPVRLTLTVLGDVDNPLTIRGLQDVPETVKLKHKDKTVAAAPLAPVIEQASRTANAWRSSSSPPTGSAPSSTTTISNSVIWP